MTTTTHFDDYGPGLDRLESVLVELLRLQGFAGGRLRDETLDLEDVAARDGGLPLFLAQAAIWADYAGIPQVTRPFDVRADSEALTRARAVLQLNAPSSPATIQAPSAPLLFFMNQVVHVARSQCQGQRLDLLQLVEPHHPGVLADALSIRRRPQVRSPRPD